MENVWGKIGSGSIGAKCSYFFALCAKNANSITHPKSPVIFQGRLSPPSEFFLQK
jgi:hypothetical protein